MSRTATPRAKAGRVLVTGASGFAGTHLARGLAEAGHEVVALVRGPTRSPELERLGVEIRVGDIGDPSAVASAFERFRTVYHLASAFRTEHADLEEFRRVNVEGTRCLLEAAREHGVSRFVHCSTVGVHGHIKSPPADESSPLVPEDHYQESKLEGELLARSYIGAGPMEISVVRPVGIYGPGDTRFLKLFRGVARRRFIMVGSGRTLYHMTFVDDLIRGFLLAGSHPAAAGQVFIIAGPRYTTLDELFGHVARSVDVPFPRFHVPYGPVYAAAILCQVASRLVHVDPPLYPRRVSFFVHDRAFDCSKAHRILGYQPRVDLEEGCARTAAWYRERGLL